MTRALRQPMSTASATSLLGLAGLAAGAIAVFGDKGSFSWFSVAMAVLAVVPWAVVAVGVHVPVAVFAAAALTPSALDALVDLNVGAFFPMMIVIVYVGRCGRAEWSGAVALGATLATIAAHDVIQTYDHDSGAIFFAGGAVLCWFTGMMLRRQEQLVSRLTAVQAAEAEHAAQLERTRIAREVHDVVAHSLSVTMLHVSGARRMIATDPAQAQLALEQAEQVGRDSLDSIRRVVGLLRAGESGSAGATEASGRDERSELLAGPLPGLADIPDLIDQFRSTDRAVAAVVELDDIGVDATTGLAAYRVVQEALSNAVQHAHDAPITVRVHPDSNGTVLRLVVENPVRHHTTGAAAGNSQGRRTNGTRAGLGLVGMAERVRAAGGSVEASMVGSTFRVDAALPLRRFR